MSTTSTAGPDPLDVEGMRVVSIKEAARLRGVSEDTIRWTLKHRIVRLSPRRIGLRLRDVLATD
jgi:hypothetical protein